MSLRVHDLSSFLTAFGLCATTAVASVVYVDDDAPPAGDGQTWATAYRFLQDALAEHREMVWENPCWHYHLEPEDLDPSLLRHEVRPLGKDHAPLVAAAP